METKKNYREFDYQTIVAKKDKVDEVIKRYDCLGWKAIEFSEHDQYANLIEIEFSRKHFIKNKDDLQLLQIYIENDLNQIGKAEKYKHSKTTALGLLLGVFLVCLLTSGISLLCLMNTLTVWIVSSVLLFLALVSGVFELIYLPKVYRKEKVAFSEKIEKFNAELDVACAKAKDLTGEKDGNNKEEK